MNLIKIRHAISIGCLFSMGSLIITLGSGGYHTLQALITGFLLSIVLLLFYQNLLNKYPNRNLYEIIKLKYNNIIGKIMICLYLLLLLYLIVETIFIFINFITTINELDYMSKSIIMVINLVLIGYVLKNSLIVICRFTQVAFVLTVIMILVIFIIGFKEINFSNLLPINPIYKKDYVNQVHNFMIKPFIEMTLLFNVFCKLENTKHKSKIFIIVGAFSLLFLAIINIETVGILGSHFVNKLNFPYHASIACISLTKIVIRMESISLIVLYFCAFVKVVFCMHSLVIGFNNLFNINKKYYYPFLLLVHILSLVFFRNIQELNFTSKYANVFSLIVAILMVLLIYAKREEKNIMYIT